MRSPRPLRSTLLALAATFGLVGGRAAAQTPGTPQVAPAEFQAVLAEYRAAQQRFTLVYDQAFQSSQALRDQEAALNEAILRGLSEELPGADAEMARLDSLQMAAMQAQQAQDGARMNAIINEAGAVQTRLQAARDRVMERPDVRARVATLEAELMRTMVGIDPSMEALVARMDELVAILNAGPAGG